MTLPIGRTDRLEAVPLSADGESAVLIRERGIDSRARALLTTDKLPAGERLVVMPLDDDVEIRVDGDALAVWLAGSPLSGPDDAPRAPGHVPIVSSIAGGAILIVLLAMAVIGSAVTFAWLVESLT